MPAGDDAKDPAIKDGAQPTEVVKPEKGEEASPKIRDNLLAKLEKMGEVGEDPPPEKEPETEPEAEAEDAKEPETEPEAEAEDAKEPETEPEADPEDEVLAAIEKADQPPPDPERIPNTDYRRLSKEGRQAIEAIRSKRKAVEEELAKEKPHAEYGRKIAQVLDAHGIPDEDFNQWVHLGTVVAKGGQPAVDALVAMATQLGYTPPAAKPQEFTRPPWLKAMVDNGDVDEAQASTIEAKLRAETPPPQPERRAAPPPPAREARRPDAGQAKIHAANQSLTEFDATNRAKFGERAWTKLREEVKAEVAAFKGAPPETWRTCYEKALELVVAKHRAKARKPEPRSSLAGSSASRAGSKLESLKGRERVTEMARRGML